MKKQLDLFRAELIVAQEELRESTERVEVLESQIDTLRENKQK